MEWQGNCSNILHINKVIVPNTYESPDQDRPLDLSTERNSHRATTSNGSHHMALGNCSYTNKVHFNTCEINDEPLDLSMKCSPSIKCCPSKCVPPRENKFNRALMCGGTVMEISVVPDKENNNKEFNKDANNCHSKLHSNRQPSSGHIAPIPTNPDSAEEDLTMISTRLELVVLKHHGYILNFDKKSAVTEDALVAYKIMESKFREMVHEPVDGKDYTDVLQFCQFKWRKIILMLKEFYQTTTTLIRNFPHFNKFEPSDQQNVITYAVTGFVTLSNLSVVDFKHNIRIWRMKDGEVCLLGDGLVPSFYPKEGGKSIGLTTLKKLDDLNLSIQQLILLRCMHVYSKEFAVTGHGYLMASKIQYLLSEAFRHSIEQHQKDETLLPRVMTIMQTDFLEYIKLRASVNSNMQDKLRQVYDVISAGTLTPEQCRKWMTE